MDTPTRLAAGLLAATVLGGNAAAAQTQGQPSDCPNIRAVERIDGTVVTVDAQQGTLTLLGSDGTTYKFQAARETLQDLKVGDKIETKLRISDKCRKG